MKKTILIFGLFLFAAASVKMAFAKVIDRTVAVVNDEAITEYELNQAISLRLAGSVGKEKNSEKGKDFRKATLEELIHSRLLEQEVEKSKTEVTNEELGRAIGRFLQQNRITIEQLKSSLAQQGVGFEAFKDRMEKELRHAKFIQQTVAGNVQVSEEDVRRYKEQNRQQWGPQVFVRVAMLYLPFDSGESAKELKAKKESAETLAEEARGVSDFKAFAEERKKKTNIQFLDDSQESRSLDTFSKEVGSVLSRMEVESVSGPIVTPRGIYIAWLYEKKTAAETVSAEEDSTIMGQLYNQKMEQEINSFLLALRKKSYIEIR